MVLILEHAGGTPGDVFGAGYFLSIFLEAVEADSPARAGLIVKRGKSNS